MGMNIDCILYLQKKGLLTADNYRMLDIGPQNVYFATSSKISQVVEQQGPSADEQAPTGTALAQEIDRIAYFSTPRPEERTSLFSEIANISKIEYNAFDVCPAPNTEILDLNFDSLPDHYRDYYDVVLNFGTTEHVFNQWNSFKLMHDACRIGGTIYCVLPMSGYLDHGYYCYTPLFFEDMAKANGYEIIDLFIAQAGLNDVNDLKLDTRGDGMFDRPRSATLQTADARVPNFNIHAIMRKTSNRPFSATLEVATAHSAVDTGIASRYTESSRGRDGSETAIGTFDQHDAASQDYAAERARFRRELDARIAERDQAKTERDEFRRQNERLTGEVAARIMERDQYHTERDSYASKVGALMESKSWRVTAPFRAVRQLLG